MKTSEENYLFQIAKKIFVIKMRTFKSVGLKHDLVCVLGYMRKNCKN